MHDEQSARLRLPVAMGHDPGRIGKAEVDGIKMASVRGIHNVDGLAWWACDHYL